MGKATKWICNFLTGKKEEKEKKKSNYSSAESSAVLQSTPRDKRRWSFGRSARTDPIQHKSTRSFDSNITSQLVTQGLLEYENDKYAKPVVAKTVKSARKSVAGKKAPDFKSGPLHHAAATIIQAAFRSYLARKALSALKGLVKLQALVRGHLVRKQTSAMLRSMQALMSIQARAQVQRIQMAEEAQVTIKRRIPRTEFAQTNQITNEYRETIDLNINYARRLKSKSGNLNHLETERTQHGANTYYMERLSLSKQEKLQIHPSSPALPDMRIRSRERKIEEFFFNTAPIVSQQHSPASRANTTNAPFKTLPQFAGASSHDKQFVPNYMSNTKSSRAKVRSQSEPKQRPKWSMKQENRQEASMKGIINQHDTEATQRQHLSPHSKHRSTHNGQKNHWFFKLYQSTKASMHS